MSAERTQMEQVEEAMVSSMTCTREKTMRMSTIIGARTSATTRAPAPALNTAALEIPLNAKSGRNPFVDSKRRVVTTAW